MIFLAVFLGRDWLSTINTIKKEFYLNQGSELEEEKGTYYTLYRGLDNDIVRWQQYDPKTNTFESPYVSMAANPVMYNDLLGDSPDCPENANEGDTYDCGGTTFTYSEGKWSANLDEFTFVGEKEWTSEAEQWDYYSDYEHYIEDYPEFKGMTQKQAENYWEKYYSEEFYKSWNLAVQKEREKEVVQKLYWFATVFSYESFVVGPVTGVNMYGNLGRTKSFQFVKRYSYINNHTNESVWGYYGINANYNVRYVGITKNPTQRFYSHRLSLGTGKENLSYELQIKFNNRLRARIWEQQNINKFRLKNLLNKRQPV